MVYLIVTAAAAAAASLLASLYALSLVWRLPQSVSGHDLKALRQSVSDGEAMVKDCSRRVHELEQALPVIRGEVAEALTRVDSRFNAARAAEERTRRIARNAAEEEDRGEELSEEEFLRLAASSAAEEEPNSHQLSWPDIERLAFERRQSHRGR